ncbi:MAG: hypothetical protein JXA81_15200 [Sedimentisphaerales bacterium]|nr:hypothetical protein [Sedimentisphaerales bacterium]
MEIQQIPKSILTVLNQLYELEEKIKKQDDPANLSRNVGKIKDAFAEDSLPLSDAGGGQSYIGLAYEDPMGQPCKETRTDLEATISGPGTENLVVVEVIKPIIRAIFKDSAGKFSKIIQKGIVIVESRKEP